MPAPSTGPSRRRTPCRIAVALLATGLLAPAVGLAGSAPAFAGPRADAAFVAAINAERIAHGEHAYRVSSDLTAVATAQARRMAGADSLFHNPHLTTDVTHWLAVGENVGYGPDVTSLVNAFWNSPEHKANVLDDDFTQVGVGTVVVNGTMWVSEVFRKPDAAAAATTATAPRRFKHRLSMGSHGRRVAWVQHRLHVTVDGIFGRQTKHAVNRFKRHHGMRPNGVVGRPTWRKLHRTG